MKTTMKKSVARILTAVLVLVMMMSLAVPAMAKSLEAAEGLDEVKHGVFKFNMKIDLPGYGGWVSSRGTAFLINDEYIITAAHCVRFTEYEANQFGHTLSDEVARMGILKAEPSYSVTVERDLTVGATLVNYSENMDFAILKLDQPIPTRKYLTLRDSKSVKAGEAVYSVGYPAFYDGQNYDNNYTVDDVTIKSGVISKIQNVVEFNYGSGQKCKLDILATTCNLSGGDSGGPMVDENGYVVGVSIAGVDQSVSNNYYMASAIDQIMRACDNLGIEYHTADEVVPVVEETEAPTEAPVVEVTEPPVVETTEPPVVETTEPPVVIEEEEEGLPVILIVAAIAVVAVIVVVVVVMSKGKKKAVPAPAPAAPATSGFAPAPHVPAQTANMDAGATTVLTADAGATTVLRHSVNGGSLLRKRTGETVAVNVETFVIGRERKNVNYCLADNSSISRTHVTLSVRNGVTYLMDMGAANGTFVNGVKLAARQEVALKNGDKITLADEEFEFKA